MIRPATSEADYALAGALITEYIEWLPFVLDFQDYEVELENLRNRYAPPAGVLLLAIDESEQAIGTVAVRPFDPDIAELKRMYVQPAGRGQGWGRRLADAAIDFARSAGYQAIRLDSDEASMPEANALYEKLGFVDIERYRPNDLPCARFMEMKL